MSAIKYQRILLKLSGEALMGSGDFGIDPAMLRRLAADIGELVAAGVQVGLVIGGGNIFRGAGLAEGGLDRVRGDQMGMLATVMNALAMQDALEKAGIAASTLSAIPMDSVCDSYSKRRAMQLLEAGQVALFAAGTGNPFFTTDSAASLRAIEIQAQLLIKATKVNGIYSADPMQVADARFYPSLSYDQVLAEKLAVMDTAAIVLCRDQGLPLQVMNIQEPKAILRAVQGEAVGSLVHSGA
ncbi:MAG: UMP kinase [Gammaproteobacteria bacterium SHHR-1]|uniref:UMP kinase n=1 Tax=Magnetovirga frankeli TaxID=947516 RepID=UPI0012931921|nr:UMP kinase [gamma proteobacterium SS-5]